MRFFFVIAKAFALQAHRVDVSIFCCSQGTQLADSNSTFPNVSIQSTIQSAIFRQSSQCDISNKKSVCYISTYGRSLCTIFHRIISFKLGE